MTKEQLIERKNIYDEKKQELMTVSYEAEIEAELAKERERLEKKI